MNGLDLLCVIVGAAGIAWAISSMRHPDEDSRPQVDMSTDIDCRWTDGDDLAVSQYGIGDRPYDHETDGL